MKYCCLILSHIIFSQSYAQLSNTQIKDLKNGKLATDTSYIYRLPFAKGNKYFLIQAYNSNLSHKNELSLDFKMHKGSTICAAREGIVQSIKKDSEVGGLKNEYMNEGNHIIIRHIDGSVAYYWHLQKNGVFLNVGDTVTKGQTIGYSGNTGYTAFPHLHFQVQDKNGNDIATRFTTKKGIIYLRPGKWYKAVE